MEDPWFYVVSDDDDSSYCSQVDSDKIDSETEAELYSMIHHEPNLSCISAGNLNENPSELVTYSPCMNKQENTFAITTSEKSFLNQNTCNNFTSGKRKSSEMDADSERLNEKLSPVKKDKSKSISQNVNLNSNDFKNVNDSLQFSINTNQSRKNVLNSKSEANLNERTLLNSSDSDDDIWIEQSSAEKSDLKINLLNDIEAHFLDFSDSDNEPDVSSLFEKRDSVLRNLSMPNIKTAQDSKEPWLINSEDLYRSKKYSHRYHDNFDVTCSNCNKKGHTSRTCPSPRVIKCFVCGGNHMGFRCPNRICSNCHAFGHDRKNCWKEIYRGLCHLCKMEGHGQGNCPDLWRRYHLTTNPSKIIRGKQVQGNTNLYCWNCGRSGHFGVVCRISQSSKNCFNTLPCVVSYDNPNKLLKSRLSLLRKYSYLSTIKKTDSINNISSTSSGNKSINLKPRNEFNISSGSIEESIGNKNRKRKPRTALRFIKVQDIVKESDFPRTPKKSPIKNNNVVKSETQTLSPRTLMNRQLKKLKTQWNKQFKRIGYEAMATATEDVKRTLIDITPSLDDNLPSSVQLMLEKRFKKWKKNRINRFRKLKQKKERELTNS